MYSPLRVNDFLDLRDLSEKIETISVQIEYGLYGDFFTDTMWDDVDGLV